MLLLWVLLLWDEASSSSCAAKKARPKNKEQRTNDANKPHTKDKNDIITITASSLILRENHLIVLFHRASE